MIILSSYALCTFDRQVDRQTRVAYHIWGTRAHVDFQEVIF